ncbi:MAG: hypothetical protein PHP44_05475 [Kiritimatiellae bacterium]|nr:hypothetical protein [Kiritimatiellia bacterium]MDD4735538.1 hypothetical protein [Kiritimatiellia bacterium]
MKKKNTANRNATTGESFNQNLQLLTQQLGLYAVLLRNASAKQRIVNS